MKSYNQIDIDQCRLIAPIYVDIIKGIRMDK